MAIEPLVCHEGDTRILAFSLTRGGTAVNLAGATVTLTIAGLALYDEPMTIADAAAGLVTYQLGEGVAVEGWHDVYATVALDGETGTFPGLDDMVLRVKNKPAAPA